MLKMDVIYIVPPSFRHQIHCGHLFLLQNVETKQFIKFNLSTGGRKTFKIFVMGMDFFHTKKTDSTAAGL